MPSNIDSPWWFLTFFLGMWIGISGLLSAVSGWYQLSKRFPCPKNFQAEKSFRMTSMSLGYPFLPVNYGHCVFVRIGEAGIRLSVLFLFRLFDPPMLIPWRDIERVRQSWYLFFKSTVITIRNDRRRFRFYFGTGEEIYVRCKRQGIIEA